MNELHNNYTIALVGPEDMTSGFKAFGIDIFPAESADDALAHIKNIRAQAVSEDTNTKRYGIIMVIDSLLADIPADEYERISRGALPSLLAIPGITSETDAGTQKLRAMAEKAIGSDILS